MTDKGFPDAVVLHKDVFGEAEVCEDGVEHVLVGGEEVDSDCKGKDQLWGGRGEILA